MIFVSTGILPLGIVFIDVISKSPKKVKPRVLGIGVAVRYKASVFGYFSINAFL